jgi:two-component system, OmpR family, phosphate regulon response regulator PhoB
MSCVLLAEDDADIRHLVAIKLERAGVEVAAVADGFAALREAQHRQPDLIILDVRMPRMSGVDVCRELRGNRATAQIPIIMLTARTRPQDLEAAYSAGADEFMAKPFSPRHLLERVETMLARVRT